MDFFLNELSLHNQFSSFEEFLPALQKTLKCKDVIDKYGFRLYCERTITNRPVYKSKSFAVAILSSKEPNFKRKIRIWLERTGPFWDTPPRHNPDDYFEYEQEPLEEYASVAEAAFYIATQQGQREMVSFSPSNFEKTPLLVRWHKTDLPQEIPIPNYWQYDTLQPHLQELQSPPSSWTEMIRRVQANCSNLIFLDTVTATLKGEAFSTPIMERVMFQLKILNKLARCFNDRGQRTQSGHDIIQTYFTGNRAIFSDESNTNKDRFEKELTFTKPDGKEIFCPYHGKTRHRVFRLHFSWPIRHNESVYIAYIGPKITKR